MKKMTKDDDDEDSKGVLALEKCRRKGLPTVHTLHCTCVTFLRIFGN